MTVAVLVILAALAPAPATTQSSEQTVLELQQVESLIEDGDRDAAIRRFTHVPHEVSDQATAVRTKVNQAADEMLDEVDQMLARKEYPAAAAQLKKLLGTFAGLPTASLARQRLAELVSHREIVREWILDEHREKAQLALAEARKLRDDGKEEEAYLQFKLIASAYHDTQAGVLAADAVKAFDADAGFSRRQKDRAAAPKARPALNLAENYRSAGRVESAKKKYEEVIASFPGTSFAEAARRELDAMK